LAGIILSYQALWELAALAGSISPGLTWLWPLTLDALAIVASLNVLWAETRRERDRYGWNLVLLFTFLSVIFNAAHAGLDRLLVLGNPVPLAIAIFVGVLPPVAAAFALHLLVRLLRRILERVSLISSLAELNQQRSQLAARLSEERQQAIAEIERLNSHLAELTTKRDQIEQDIDRLKKDKRQRANGNRPDGAEISEARIDQARAILQQRLDDDLPLPSGAELGRLLGVSKTTGNSLKKLLLPNLKEMIVSGQTSPLQTGNGAQA
jgi:hypothetical protein